MDEQKNNANPQNVPSGFDSVSNIGKPENTSEPVFNPTPMFSKMQQNENKEYTVAPTEGFSDNSAPAEKKEPATEQMPKAEEVTTGTDTENKTTMPADTLKEATPTAPVHDFLPNGTYSYSAAKGNLPDSAVNEPAKQPEFTSYYNPDIPPVNTAPVGQPGYNAQQPVYNSYVTDEKPKKAKKQKASKHKANKKYGAGVVVTSVILAMVLGLGGGIAGSYLMLKNQTPSETPSTNIPQNVTTINVNETANSIAEAVAKKAGPSVIGIRTTAAVTNFFFGTSEATEEGSGIIYTTDGYIITNYHVIQSAVESSNSKVEVFLPDDAEKSIEATVIGYNISYDLAVIKINSSNLTAIEFSDSSTLTVGQQVVAIGNPGGLEFIGSVSTGVISGLNRSITVDNGSTMSLIQTDAAINPGNSGGALVNAQGQLVGVNSIKLVSTGYEGMGFAIPSNTVKEICDKIIAKQNEPTPYIGIQISQTYTAAQLKALGYPAGAVITSVAEGSPAHKGDLQRGDIITKFNNITINNYTDLDGAIADCKPGDSVTVEFYRAGKFFSSVISIEANNAQ